MKNNVKTNKNKKNKQSPEVKTFKKINDQKHRITNKNTIINGEKHTKKHTKTLENK